MFLTPTYAIVETITADEYLASDFQNISGFIGPLNDDQNDTTNIVDESLTIIEVGNRSLEAEQLISQTYQLDTILALGHILFKDGRDLTPEESSIVEKYYEGKYEIVD